MLLDRQQCLLDRFERGRPLFKLAQIRSDRGKNLRLLAQDTLHSALGRDRPDSEPGLLDALGMRWPLELLCRHFHDLRGDFCEGVGVRAGKRGVAERVYQAWNATRIFVEERHRLRGKQRPVRRPRNAQSMADVVSNFLLRERADVIAELDAL